MALQDRESIFDTDENDQLHSLTYDGAIDEDIINVLKETASEDFWYEKISERLKLEPKYVQLILHYLAALDLVDYGTSPRGSWISQSGERYLHLLKNFKSER